MSAEHAVARAQVQSDHRWRPSVFEGMLAGHPATDGQLLGVALAKTLLGSVPGMAEKFKREVPDEFVAIDLNDESYSTAFISCRCGEVHEVEIGTIASGDCGRFFAWFGGGVRFATPD